MARPETVPNMEFEFVVRELIHGEEGKLTLPADFGLINSFRTAEGKYVGLFGRGYTDEPAMEPGDFEEFLASFATSEDDYDDDSI